MTDRSDIHPSPKNTDHVPTKIFPAFEFLSDVRDAKIQQKAFQYPSPEETKKAEDKITAKAVLSTAGRTKAGKSTTANLLRSSSKGSEVERSTSKGGEKEEPGSAKKEDGKKDAALGDKKEGDKKDAKDKEEKKPEIPALLALKNPARVVPAQEPYIKFLTGKEDEKDLPPLELDAPSAVDKEKDPDAMDVEEAAAGEKQERPPLRYVPILGQMRKSGFVLLTDLTPDEPEEFVEAAKEGEDKVREYNLSFGKK